MAAIRPLFTVKYVKDLAVRKHRSSKALDELVHCDADLVAVLLDHRKRFDMRIELTPLSPDPFRSVVPVHVFRHQF
jgi:hypothetical protein